MTERAWRDLIAGDRMRVDQEFAGAVQQSGFSRSEWGMIMTAVDFEVEGEGESARLVADTSKVDVIMPELDKIVRQMGGESSGGSSGSLFSRTLAGSIVDSLRSSFGAGGSGGGSGRADRRQEAIRLANDYADALQGHLENRDRWERIRDLAIEQDQSSPE